MNEKIILIGIYLLGWLIIYLTELLKAYREPFIRSHYVTVGVIRFSGIIMGFFLLFFLAFLAQPRIGGVFSIVSIAMGIALIGIAIYYLARFFIEWGKDLKALAESRYLFATGLYGKSRHPTYIAGLFLLWGWYFAWRAVYGLLSMPIILIAFLIEIFIEEKTLNRRFGEEHARYRQRVPVLLPFPLSVILIVVMGIVVISIIFRWIQII
jgi:protein-S-isoprenylcysteine O-methyltransferase Ste14